jgi:hypothetical protein
VRPGLPNNSLFWTGIKVLNRGAYATVAHYRYTPPAGTPIPEPITGLRDIVVKQNTGTPDLELIDERNHLVNLQVQTGSDHIIRSPQGPVMYAPPIASALFAERIYMEFCQNGDLGDQIALRNTTGQVV